MRAVPLAGGLVLAALILLAGCETTTRTCVTAFETCRADEAGEPGHPCVCRFPFYADPGLYRAPE